MSIPGHLSPPRLCHLKKWDTFPGYGFNLHAEKGKIGQYIGKVEPGSPADFGGLREKDVVIEVNDINVEEYTHQKVVERVKERHNAVTMLVCDSNTHQYCKENSIFITKDTEGVVTNTTPAVEPQNDKLPDETDTAATKPESHAAAGDAENYEEYAEATETQVSAAPAAEEHDDEPPSFQPQPPPQPQPQAAAPKNQEQSDPVGSISLDEMRAKLGSNKRTKVKMDPSSFSQKYQMFQAL